MSCRVRWLEALEILEPGPLRDLVDAAGHAITGTPAALTNLGNALDSVVDSVIEQNPLDLKQS